MGGKHTLVRFHKYVKLQLGGKRQRPWLRHSWLVTNDSCQNPRRRLRRLQARPGSIEYEGWQPYMMVVFAIDSMIAHTMSPVLRASMILHGCPDDHADH